MTRLTVLRRGDGSIAGLQTEGHAGAGEEGYDLVCSAISALTITAVNALEEIAGIETQPRVASGFLSFTLPEALTEEQRHTADIILRTVLRGLTDTAAAYPAHLSIRDSRLEE